MNALKAIPKGGNHTSEAKGDSRMAGSVERHEHLAESQDHAGLALLTALSMTLACRQRNIRHGILVRRLFFALP